ncbi:MAG: hypothetical protein AB8G86_06495 [Saprospiraceae bacterium]
MNQLTSNTATYNSESISSTKANYPFFSSTFKYGVISGGLIAAFLFILQFAGMENNIGMKYFGYGLLGMVLAIGLTDYDQFLKTGTTFKSGMSFAAQITLFAGATIIAINAITFLLGSSLVFSKYGVEVVDFSSLLMISGAIFLEIMVAGLIFTFITLQYLKSRKDYDG